MNSCNICTSKNLDLLFSNAINSTARLEKIPTDVQICKNCGHVFLNYSFLKNTDLEKYYQNNNPFEKVEELDVSHRNMRNEQVNFVLNNINQDYSHFKFLDIGCGSGFYLKLLKDKKLYCEGVERSDLMCSMISSYYDIKCTNTSFEELKLNNKFDVVSMITVIEHLYDPKKCLLKIKELLNDNGYLFIEIPDSQFPRYDILPDYLAFEHLHHWTKVSFTNLLNITGFEIVSIDQKRNSDDSGNPENILRILAKKLDTTKELFENDYQNQLKNLKKYKENHEIFINNFKTKIDNILSKTQKEKINIYCAGLHTNTLLSLFPNIIEKIDKIYDSDTNLNNTSINKIQILSPDEIKQDSTKNFIMSTTNHEHTIYKFLKSINKDFKVYGLYNDFD